MSDETCGHVDRVAIHPSVKIGGATVGVCDRKRLPGMTVCAWHADPDAVTTMMTQLAGEARELALRLESMADKAT